MPRAEGRRRRDLLAGAGVALVPVAGRAQAPSWPDRPARLAASCSAVAKSTAVLTDPSVRGRLATVGFDAQGRSLAGGRCVGEGVYRWGGADRQIAGSAN